MMRRPAFTGARDWTDEAPVRAVLWSLPLDSIVLVGDAPGLDDMVAHLCAERGLPCERFVAEWLVHAAGWCRCSSPRPPSCKGAGPRRNQRIVDEGKPTDGYAFPGPKSTGTHDMIRRLRAAGLVVDVYGKRRPPVQAEMWGRRP